MGTRTVKVVDKIASFSGDALICNNEYDFVFDFDDEWDGHEKKIARFISEGIETDVEIKNNTCKSPKFSKTQQASVGVFVEGVIATTEAAIPCKRSILCNGATKEPIYNGEYELLVPSVSGVWVFNDALNEVHEGLNCENLTYTMVDVDISYKGLGFRAADGSMYPLDEPDIDFYSGGSWNDEFQTIDFGTEPQEVSEEFYAWLTANAVKQ